MNFPFNTGQHKNATAPLIAPELSSFMLESADELEWILRASGEDEHVATARTLTEALVRGEADSREAYEVLAELREVLIDVPAQVSVVDHFARPDLDAAVRWFGARLDEFLSIMRSD